MTKMCLAPGCCAPATHVEWCAWHFLTYGPPLPPPLPPPVPR